MSACGVWLLPAALAASSKQPNIKAAVFTEKCYHASISWARETPNGREQGISDVIPKRENPVVEKRVCDGDENPRPTKIWVGRGTRASFGRATRLGRSPIE